MNRIGRTADRTALKDAAKALGLVVPPAVVGDIVTSRSAMAANPVGGSVTFALAEDHLPALRSLIDTIAGEMPRQI